MADEHIVSNESLKLGLLRVNLIQGDVLSCPTDVVLCPVDQKGAARTGLFSVLQQRGTIPSSAFGDKKWMAMGDCCRHTVTDLPFEKIILITLYSEALGNSNRAVIQQGLVKALTMADDEGALAVSCPMLGHAKSNLDYSIMASVMIKGAIEFSKKEPKNVRRLFFFAYNTKAFLAAEAQMMEFQQGL